MLGLMLGLWRSSSLLELAVSVNVRVNARVVAQLFPVELAVRARRAEGRACYFSVVPFKLGGVEGRYSTPPS